MRVLIINSVCGIRSTGRIATDIAKEYMSQGHTCRIAYGREYVPEEYQNISYKIGSRWKVMTNGIMARVFDNEGFNAKLETLKFIKWANTYNPDLLWIHNIHGYYININMLFDWIKSRPQMKVNWTLHDCWSFTGHCSHFSHIQCYKWEEQCKNCAQKKEYPGSLVCDHSLKNFRRKKDVFLGVKDMTIITPSQWLADLVKRSFLNEYPIEVHYNTIDKNVFSPVESNFRERMGLHHKKIVLGVASTWGERKGLGMFEQLSRLLPDQYQVVLVGPDKKQSACLPDNIICIGRTDSVQELAEIYSSADVFVNPSTEETFGLTTLEALSCGTQAIVYANTACEEVARMYGGIVVERDCISLLTAIRNVCEGK